MGVLSKHFPSRIPLNSWYSVAKDIWINGWKYLSSLDDKRGLGEGVQCDKGYPSETHLKLKSREISFAHNLLFIYPIVFEFCTEHGSDTGVLCAIFQNDWAPAKQVIDKRDFARFEFKMSFARIPYIAQDLFSVSYVKANVGRQNIDIVSYRWPKRSIYLPGWNA